MTTQHALSVFTNQALRQPSTTGAIAPSSSTLARILASIVPTEPTAAVVELGPGTGVVSDAISARCPQHTAIEVNEHLVQYMRRTRPHIHTVHAAAQHFQATTQTASSSVDAVVSGLPWSLFDRETRDQILDDVAAVLTPAGAFSTFAYVHALRLPGSKALRASLTSRFDEVTVSRTVWRNLPPAITYICHRPVG